MSSGNVVAAIVTVLVSSVSHGGRTNIVELLLCVSVGDTKTVPYGHGGGWIVRGATDAGKPGGGEGMNVKGNGLILG